MIFASVPNSFWDKFPARSLATSDMWKLGKPGRPAYMTGKGELPATYIFKTREGGIGILQITGFNDEPRGVKIRYQMLKNYQKPVVQVEGEKTEQKEQIEKISRLINAELPRSISNVKFHQKGPWGILRTFVKFDIPISDLKILLHQSYMLTDFDKLSKDGKIRIRMKQDKLGPEWWTPDVLKEPLYGHWARGYWAPEGTVWTHDEWNICCSEINQGQMRVYLYSRSNSEPVYWTGSKEDVSKKQIIEGKLQEVLDDPNVIKETAEQFFNKIRTADYDYFLDSKNPKVWKEFPIVGHYNALQGYQYPDLVMWICRTFKKNPIISVQLGNPIASMDKWPVLPYTIVLRDGKIIEGDLRFTYHFYSPESVYGKEVVDQWLGVHGIDWNLKPESELYKIPNLDVGVDEVIQASELGAAAEVSAEKGLQGLIDAARAGVTVIVPEGIYTEPVRIDKSLKLKGKSLRGSVFEVTANEPAIFIDTKGKGKVSIEGVTIKWQLATSDKGIEHPFAVAVKDTKAEIKRCNFVPLGNPKRSPVAIRAMGFSNLNIESCRFEGFEYVVCYGEGTEGVMSDSLIMDCGHQGVILYSGAKAKILRNVITGSRYHAVRSTGGTLDVRDNLLIENANRGIYLGNKSARGVIANNIIMGNGTGISGFARSRVRIQNNIIADSSYAGISMRDSCNLSIRNNILQGNAKGCIVHKEGSKNANKVFRNLFWENEIDVENFAKPAVSISVEPGFADPDNGDFSLKAGEALENKQGLSDPNVFKILWKRWENRDDKNEPFNVPDTKTDSDIEAKEP